MKIAHELHELREKKNLIIRVNSFNSWASSFSLSPGEAAASLLTREILPFSGKIFLFGSGLSGLR
jgi:hypothetical protein